MKLSAFIGVSALVLCQASQAQVSKFEGLTATAGLGYQSTTTKISNLIGGWDALTHTLSADASTSLIGNVGVEYGWALSEKSVISIGLDYNLGKGKDVTPTFDGSADTNGAINAQQNYRMSVSSGWLVNQDQLAYVKLGLVNVKSEFKTLDTGVTDSANTNSYSVGVGTKIYDKSGSFFYFGELNYLMGRSKTATWHDGSVLSYKSDGYQFMVGVGKHF